jgi:phospholipid/cholesterol/gamma-HCH transport system substrate-binding protein
VKIGGVQVGEVSKITLDPVTFKAVVKMKIQNQFNNIPIDSSAGIYTAGLLGDNYVSISPMYSTTFLNNGSKIEMTHGAMVLEKLIGQFIYKLNNSSGNTDTADNTKKSDHSGITHIKTQ